jgi:hypothetical protein
MRYPVAGYTAHGSNDHNLRILTMKAGAFAALSVAATIGGCLLDTTSYAQQPVYQMQNGAPCRQSVKNVIYWGRVRPTTVFFCQQPNGAWLEVNPAAVVARAPQAVQPYYGAQRPPTPGQPYYAAQRPAAPAQAPQAPAAAPTDPLTKSVDDVLIADSRGWVMNKYVLHSARNARVLSHSEDNSNAVIYGEYTLNQRQTGWLKIKYVNNQVSCLEFFDFPGNCRAMGHSPGQVLAGAAIAGVIAAAADSGNASSGSSDQSGRDFDRSRQQAEQQAQQQADREAQSAAAAAQNERMQHPNSLGW